MNSIQYMLYQYKPILYYATTKKKEKKKKNIDYPLSYSFTTNHTIIL